MCYQTPVFLRGYKLPCASATPDCARVPLYLYWSGVVEPSTLSSVKEVAVTECDILAAGLLLQPWSCRRVYQQFYKHGLVLYSLILCILARTRGFYCIDIIFAAPCVLDYCHLICSRRNACPGIST